VLSLCDGIRKISNAVATGSFDRFMLSPKNLLMRIATSSFGASAFGDVIFGIICLVIYAFLIHVSFLQILFMAFSVIISTIVVLSIIIVVYSMSFFFTDPNAIAYGLFQLFLTPSLFHGGAFHGIMRFIFTFFIPSLLIGTLPVEIVRDISVSKLLLISVLAVFWFIISIKIFKLAVKRYESSNFMTFGN
jgi:ABC-2 type transport system permease protein